MADETSDPIASTAAFRAFSAGDSGGDHGGADPARRRPSTLVTATAIVLLAAIVLGILVAAL